MQLYRNKHICTHIFNNNSPDMSQNCLTITLKLHSPVLKTCGLRKENPIWLCPHLKALFHNEAVWNAYSNAIRQNFTSYFVSLNFRNSMW